MSSTHGVDNYGFPRWPGEHWLDCDVTFKMFGEWRAGHVIGVERHYLCNGIHDILEVEILDDDSQMKIQAHRQKFRRTL